MYYYGKNINGTGKELEDDCIKSSNFPSLFEPFVSEGKDILYAFKGCEDKSMVCFKGDCDQDRPSNSYTKGNVGAEVD